MIPLFKVHMPSTVDKPLLEVLHSGFIGQGAQVEKFEEELKAYFGNPRVLTLNSGTSGLHLALRLADVSQCDEVICTPMTCTASNMPVLALGAKVVWADVNKITGLIDPESIEEKITAKTKAIIVVHFGGRVCNLDRINEIAKFHNIKVIEDAAHAFGSEYKNKKIGNHSDFVIFSLQAIKHITTVDGGLLLCKSQADYKRGKLLRWYGIDRDAPRKDFRCEENIMEFGYKFHMNDVCAVIGREQLKYVDSILEKHKKHASIFNKHLKGLVNIQLIPFEDEIQDPAFWLYTIHVRNRDSFISFMSERGVVVSRVHERNDIHAAFSSSASILPGVDAFNGSQISIPVGWWLAESDVLNIIALVKEWDSVYAYSN